MEVLAASVIAVVGTLLGTMVTHRFQRQSTRLAARISREERDRQERLDACAVYGGALMDYRRGVLDHCFARRDDRPADECLTLRRELFQRRTAAQEAMFRVELLSDDADLIEAARHALSAVARVYYAVPDDLDEQRTMSRTAVYDFIEASKKQLARGQGEDGEDGEDAEP